MTSWPDGAKGAVAFTFDFDAEEVWLADDPENADRPGVLSQGTYGAKVAVPLILELLERQGLRATFFVPGRVAERHPQRVREIVAAGHEVGHHGYTHTSPTALSPETRRGAGARARIAARAGRRTGRLPSPSWEFSAHTTGLLASTASATRPTSWTTSGPIAMRARAGRAAGPVGARRRRSLLVLWQRHGLAADDLRVPRTVREIWWSELDGIVDLGGCFVLTMHPQVIGRPHRLAFLEQFIADVKGRADVWIATGSEIADRVPAA